MSSFASCCYGCGRKSFNLWRTKYERKLTAAWQVPKPNLSCHIYIVSNSSDTMCQYLIIEAYIIIWYIFVNCTCTHGGVLACCSILVLDRYIWCFSFHQLIQIMHLHSNCGGHCCNHLSIHATITLYTYITTVQLTSVGLTQAHVPIRYFGQSDISMRHQNWTAPW